jgi:HK97 family phage major capsid protein
MDANGHYYGGGPYVSGVATQFWGLRRIVNEHMPQGQALVGDGRQAQIWDRMSARVEVGLVNDQFIRNMRTVRAEKSVGLAVYRPAAFALVDLFAA